MGLLLLLLLLLLHPSMPPSSVHTSMHIFPERKCNHMCRDVPQMSHRGRTGQRAKKGEYSKRGGEEGEGRTEGGTWRIGRNRERVRRGRDSREGEQYDATRAIKPLILT